MKLKNLTDKLNRTIRNPTLVTNRIKMELAKRQWALPGFGAPLPAVIYIAPTMKCNLRCRTCGLGANLSMPERIPAGTDFTNGMSWTEWRGFLDQLGTFKPKVLLSGGEPLLSEHTIPIVRHLSQRYRMHVGVGTNGLLLEHLGKELFRSGVGHLYVSIDGIGDVYEAVRGKGNFAQLQRSLAEVQKLVCDYGSAAPGINAIIVMTPYNLKSLRETMNYLVGFGIRRFSFQHFFHFTSADLERVSACAVDPRQNPRWTWGEQIDAGLLNFQEVTEAIRDLREVAGSRHDLYIEFVPDLSLHDLQSYYSTRPMPEVPGFHCPLFRIGTYIYPDGSVLPAHFCHFYPVGNVRTTPFRDIWNGSEYKWIRRTVARSGWLPACGYCMIPYGACI